MPRRCHDCAVCTQRLELYRGVGRDAAERRRLAGLCASCGHTLHRHFHGLLRSAGMPVDPEVFPAGPPPRDSPLGQLLVEMGDYDDYPTHLRRDPVGPQ